MPGPWKQLLHPIDSLRERMTDMIDVGVSDETLERGQELEVVVTISDATGLRDVEVGLVCMEYYACEMSGEDGPSKGVSSAVAYETWMGVESAVGTHTVRLAVPLDAPFSFRGDNLVFEWEAVARAARRRRLDARTGQAFTVLP